MRKSKRSAEEDAPPDPNVLRGRTARQQAAKAAAEKAEMVKFVKEKVLPALNKALHTGKPYAHGVVSIEFADDVVYITKRRDTSVLWASTVLEVLQGGKYKDYNVDLVGLEGARGLKHMTLSTINVKITVDAFLERHPKGRIGIKLS